MNEARPAGSLGEGSRLDITSGVDIVGGWFPREQRRVGFTTRPQRVRIAADIGQRADYTAIAVVEPVWDDNRNEANYVLRSLRRLPLGTTYPNVGRQIRGAAERLYKKVHTPIDVYIDATGVGRGPVDILREELADVPHRLYACTIGAGWSIKARDGEVIAPDGRRLLRASRELQVGKEHLISRTKSLLQTGKIWTPVQGRNVVLDQELAAMHRELAAFEIRSRATGQLGDSSGGKTGSHDDLVIALGLGCLLEYKGDRGTDDLLSLNRDLRHQRGPGRGLRNSGL